MYCGSLVFCWFFPLEHRLHEDRDPVSSSDWAAHSPRSPVGCRTRDGSLPPKIETIVQMKGKGGSLSEVHDRKQVHGHQSKVSSTHTLVYFCKGDKTGVCEAETDGGEQYGSRESFHLHPHVLWMFIRHLLWYIFQRNVLYPESSHTPVNVSRTCTKSPKRQLTAQLRGSSSLQNPSCKGPSSTPWSGRSA